MDAFFASVEQRDQPDLRGLPVIVGAPPDRRGVVCAASYEARKFGVRSAMPSRTAARLCPNGIFVRPRMDAYRTESSHIMEILRDATPLVEKVSVDEAYLDLSPLFASHASVDEALFAAVPLARSVKARIFSERQLTASIGVAGNKFLAKLGSDFQKPDGLTLIPERDKALFLRPLAVGAIHGVGPVTVRTLGEQGIRTIGDLQDSTRDLRPILGIWAERIRARALGIDERPVDVSDERKSIGSETTFAEDTDDRRTLRATLRELAADVSRTLEKHGLSALTVHVKVRYSNFTTLTRQARLPQPVATPEEIYRHACLLLARHRLVIGPLRLLGVTVSSLIPPSGQLHLPL